jgi:hypothetical protein
MTRPDRYDIIGLAVIALLAALWTAHFALPAPPPDPEHLAPPGALPGTVPAFAPGSPPGAVLGAVPSIAPR